MFSIAFMVFLFIDNNTDIQDGEMELFVEQLLYSKHGISHHDLETDRVYPGIIDYGDIMNTQEIEEKLNKAFNYGDSPLITARFNISFQDYITDTDIKKIKEFYYNKKAFEEYSFVTGWTKNNQQSAVKREKIIPIVLRKEYVEDGTIKEVRYPATLHIVMLSPKS